MAIQHLPYISLDEAIYGYIDEAELSQAKYFKLRNIAFRGMTQLGLNFFYQIRSVKLPVSDTLTVALPANYLNYSKVGVFNSKGEVIPLWYNQKLTTYSDLLPGRLTKTQDSTLFDVNIANSTWYNYWDGGVYTNLYGIPSGAPFAGSFKIDPANGVILLDENFSYDYVCLEYLGSPSEDEESATPIPIQFKEAMIAYLSWVDIKSLPSGRRGNLGDKRDRKHDFYNERKNAIAAWKATHLEEAHQASMEQTRLTIKV
jgi:hypothetical protein